MTVDQSALLLDEKWTKTYFKIFSESLMGDSVIWIPFMSFLSSNTKKTPKCDHLSGISDREINSTTSGLGSWSWMTNYFAWITVNTSMMTMNIGDFSEKCFKTSEHIDYNFSMPTLLIDAFII